MTTEHNPAGTPAATDEMGQSPPQSDQAPAADLPESESERDDGTEPASTTRVESTPAAAPPPAGPPSPSTPARRVRLNPTVSPNVARPIPTLPPSDPPVPPAAVVVSPVEPSATEQGTEGEAPLPEAAPTNPPLTGATPDAALQASVPPPPPAEPVDLPSGHEALDANLEAELDAAMEGDQQQVAVIVAAADASAAAADAVLTPETEVKRGTRLSGTVASIHGDDMFLDFGLRLPGVLSRRQFGLRKQPMQGEPLEVVVQRVDEAEGLIHVNLPTGTSRIRGQWEALSVGQNVECMVTGTNKGGLEVSIGALRGFVPASQVDLGFVPDLNVYVGQRLSARVTEVNPKRRKLVLSRRSLLEEEREQAQHDLFEKLQSGQQYMGRVRSLKDYGAFVDIGGVDGLLHVAQISWTRINHPSDVLTEGEEIQVQVLSVDREKKKVSLGMRQLTQNPWKAAQSKYAQGTTVNGLVTRIENFGAFVELEEGVEGMVHISELDHKRVNKVTDVLRLGQEVEVQVLEVDPKRKRVSLSVKALKEKPEEPEQQIAASPVKRKRNVDSLLGGIGEPTGGKLFGDPNKFRG